MARRRPQGHYCKICGERKSSESFSGKDHVAHIRKACSRLSPQQQAEQMTLSRLAEMSMRYLSNTEGQMAEEPNSDQRPAVRNLAHEVYAARFPHAARNQRKQQLFIKRLELTVDCDGCDLYGDPIHISESCQITRTPPGHRPYLGGRLDPDSDAAAERNGKAPQVDGTYTGDFLLRAGLLRPFRY